MKTGLVGFFRDEEGAITVDWVVLSAAIIGLAILVLGPIGLYTDNASNVVADRIAAKQTGYVSE